MTLTDEAGRTTVPSAGSDRHTVLVVDDEDRIRKVITVGLRAAGYEVITARDGIEGLRRIEDERPDIVVSDVSMPGMDGIELLDRLRSHGELRDTTFMLLTAKDDVNDVVAGFGKGADDYLAKPFAMRELVARIQAKLERPPLPVDLVPTERSTGVMSPSAFQVELAREARRAALSGRPGILVKLDVHEAAALRARLGAAAESQVWREIAAVVSESLRPLDLIGKAADGRLVLLLPETTVEQARDLMREVGTRVTVRDLPAGTATVRLTPVVGCVRLDAVPALELDERAGIALEHAAADLDLEPRFWRAEMPRLGSAPDDRAGSWWARAWRRLATPAELLVLAVVALVVPFFCYLEAYRMGVDLAPVMYLAVVAALMLTTGLIWVEGFLALRTVHPPEAGEPYPPAAAVIAAYLPNEAATIVETLQAFQRIEYPGPLEILLAYNTPHDLPIESALRGLAESDPRIRLVRVPGSTSKAQNVNYALDRTQAEMIAIFDADHHPAADSFARAWRWLASGYDVVQGRNVIRNGAWSRVSRTVGVEFELMYGVSHPGRARLHDFGLFGGSNGFWRASTLRRTRMRGAMLTEDIDSSVRVVAGGGKIRSDPLLVSTELAPTTVPALWHQRLRWAQGWFQVSLRYTLAALGSRRLTVRQKLGVVHLLAWRELYPWLSVQMFPLIAFWTWREGGITRLDWLVPVFVLTTAFTVCTGPAQTVVAYWLAHPDLRRQRRWFWWYALASAVWYSNFKVAISLLAQFRHLLGERQWRVTPRGMAEIATTAKSS